jgi:hypothetical protein
MRINELLVESQQLDEGPFTQAIGKVGGKIAKGVANVGKDLKTGFKAGYSGEQPAAAPRDPDVPINPKTGKPLTEPERQAHQDAGGKFDGVTGDPLPLDTKAAPAKSGGLKGALNSFKQGFTKGYKCATAPASDTTTTAPADQTAPASQAAPAANPKADAQSKVGVGQINKIIPTLRTRDLMSLQANLEKAIAGKKKAPAAAPAPVDPNANPAAPGAAPGSDAAKDDLYGAGNRPKGAKDKVAALKAQNKKQAAPSQAEIDADRARLMGANSESTVKKGPVIAESFSLYRKH